MIQTLKSLNLQTRILLIALVAGFVTCLIMMTVAPARSALVFQSDKYEAEIQQTHIGVTLTENGEDVGATGQLLREDQEARDYLLYNETTKKVDEFMQPGQVYREAISVKNVSDDMDEYVRLTVRKYWAEGEDGQPTKSAELDPGLIELVFDEASAEKWVFSEGESNDERLVFYYKTVLPKGEHAAEPAITGIRVSEAIKNVKQDYSKNCYLALSAQVDSVQVRNAVDAAKSAWGVDVTAFADQGLDWSYEG